MGTVRKIYQKMKDLSISKEVVAWGVNFLWNICNNMKMYLIREVLKVAGGEG